MSSDSPPYSSGVVMPNRPIALRCSTISVGYRPARSHSLATGTISLSTSCRSAWRKSCCSWVRVKSTGAPVTGPSGGGFCGERADDVGGRVEQAGQIGLAGQAQNTLGEFGRPGMVAAVGGELAIEVVVGQRGRVRATAARNPPGQDPPVPQAQLGRVGRVGGRPLRLRGNGPDQGG